MLPVMLNPEEGEVRQFWAASSISLELLSMLSSVSGATLEDNCRLDDGNDDEDAPPRKLRNDGDENRWEVAVDEKRRGDNFGWMGLLFKDDLSIVNLQADPPPNTGFAV